MKTIEQILATRIKFFRARRGLNSQDALAEASGLSKSAVAQIETCALWPSPKTLNQIAKALQVSVSDLFSEDTSRYAITPHEVLTRMREALNDPDVFNDMSRAFAGKAYAVTQKLDKPKTPALDELLSLAPKLSETDLSVVLEGARHLSSKANAPAASNDAAMESGRLRKKINR